MVDKTWRLRFCLMLGSMLFVGVSTGWIGAQYLPKHLWPVFLFTGLAMTCVNIPLTNRYVRETMADIAQRRAEAEELQQQREQIAHGTELLVKAREEQRQGFARLAEVQVCEVDLDGEIIPVADPGFTALVMDQIADRMRQEALRRAAEDHD